MSAEIKTFRRAVSEPIQKNLARAGLNDYNRGLRKNHVIKSLAIAVQTKESIKD
jgi:hypothetical protein